MDRPRRSTLFTKDLEDESSGSSKTSAKASAEPKARASKASAELSGAEKDDSEEKRLEIENFIESNPTVTLQNVLKLFGDEHINEGVIRGWFPALKNEIGNIDEIYDIPLSAFDGERLPEINHTYLRTLLRNIKTITKVIPIELNKNEDESYKRFIDTPIEGFKDQIPLLDHNYNFIKGTDDHVSKVRETLADFQPMFLERYSNAVLDLMKRPDGKRIFQTVTEMIQAFTNTTIADYLTGHGVESKIITLHQGARRGFTDTWEGNLGLIRLIIYVIPNRAGTGPAKAIKKENVIQAALLYKDRKNDFIRSYGARYMIAHNNTLWRNVPITSSKVGTNYTFSDLYTGEAIEQEYKGDLPDIGFIEPRPPHTSYLPILHKKNDRIKIATNQEHIFAVFPASCAFEENCYHEAILENLQMISAKANSDVNAVQYEDPYGKLKYLDFTHKQNKDIYDAHFLLEEVLLTKEVATHGPPSELKLFEDIKTKFTTFKKKVDDLLVDKGKEVDAVKTEIESIRGMAKKITKKELGILAEKKNILEKQYLDIDAKVQFLTSKLPSLTTPTNVPNSEKHRIASLQLDYLKNDNEFHVRKAMLMSRLSKMNDCCTRDEGLMTKRRNVVISCVKSIEVIIECAKIGRRTKTVLEDVHESLTRDNIELQKMRQLSAELFNNYAALEESMSKTKKSILDVVHSSLKNIAVHNKLLFALRKNLIGNVRLRYETKLANIKHELTQLHTNESSEDIQSKIDEEEEKLNVSASEIYDDNCKLCYVLNNLTKLGDETAGALKEALEDAKVSSVELLDALSVIDPEIKSKITDYLKALFEKRQTPVLELLDAGRAEGRADGRAERSPEGRADGRAERRPEGRAERRADDSDIFRGINVVNLEKIKKIEEALRFESPLVREVIEDEMSFIPLTEKTLSITASNSKLIVTEPSFVKPPKVSKPELLTPKVKKGSTREEWLKNFRKRREESLEIESLRKTGRFNNNLRIDEEGVRSFIHFFSFVTETAPPDEPFMREILLLLNADELVQQHIAELKSVLARRAEGRAEGRADGSAEGGSRKVSIKMVGGTIEETIMQLETAIQTDNVSDMFNLYMQYFDTEETKDIRLFDQVYSILMKKSIFVPIYRCYAPKTIDEVVRPIIEKRKEFQGLLDEFDDFYCDSFCIQFFGKNVNELLNDLAKGKLTVPQGAFPNISSYAFNPFSFICILELLRTLCLILPFAFRLHFYFAGLLSFIGETYTTNMNELQTNFILNTLKDPSFFKPFNAAASKSHFIETGEFIEDVDVDADVGADVRADVDADVGADVRADVGADVRADVGADVGADVHADAGEDVRADVGADAGEDVRADVGADAGANVDAEAEAQRQAQRQAQADYEAQTFNKEFPDSNRLNQPGGTRRKRQYKQKTKRYRTLSKRFKKNKTRRLHGAYIRQ
jgi:hypothetical protein